MRAVEEIPYQFPLREKPKTKALSMDQSFEIVVSANWYDGAIKELKKAGMSSKTKSIRVSINCK